KDRIEHNVIAGAGAHTHSNAVKGDGISREAPADEVIARGTGNEYAMEGIAQRARTIHLRSDQVGFHLVRRRAAAGYLNADKIARDNVARPAISPPDRVIGRAADESATKGVAQGGGAGDIGADEVALHEVESCLAAGDFNTVEIAGDDVARPGRRSADRVIGRSVIKYPVILVPAVGGTGGDSATENAVFYCPVLPP